MVQKIKKILVPILFFLCPWLSVNYRLAKKKNNSQPSKIKTGGSTFKNPKNQSQKKAWELIKENVDCQISFGDASISDKHANFFVNKKNAKSADMKSLINFVTKQVKDKTGVKLELEIVLVE